LEKGKKREYKGTALKSMAYKIEKDEKKMA